MGKKVRMSFEVLWTDGDAYFKTNDKRLVRKVLRRRLKTVDEIIAYSRQLEEDDWQKQFEEED